MRPRPMETAPRDHTLVAVLVDYSHCDGHDCRMNDADRAWTLGLNGFDDTGLDEWQLVGWSWSHDEFCNGTGGGTPIGWLPFPFQKEEAD